jgi:hypothetical protein
VGARDRHQGYISCPTIGRRSPGTFQMLSSSRASHLHRRRVRGLHPPHRAPSVERGCKFSSSRARRAQVEPESPNRVGQPALVVSGPCGGRRGIARWAARRPSAETATPSATKSSADWDQSSCFVRETGTGNDRVQQTQHVCLDVESLQNIGASSIHARIPPTHWRLRPPNLKSRPDGDVHDAATLVGEDHQDEQQPTCRRRHDEEICGGDLLDVIRQKRAPGSATAVCDRGPCTSRPWLDRRQQPVSTTHREGEEHPRAGGLRHRPNQHAEVGRNGRASVVSATLPRPEQPEASAMPDDDRLGLDHGERGSPIGPNMRHPDKSQRSAFRSGKHRGRDRWSTAS